MINQLHLNLDTLKKDKFVSSICETLLPNKYSKLGNFINIKNIDDLLLKISTAQYEFMRYLPLANLLIYRTSDIGIGYNKVISPSFLRELISINKVDKSTYIYLEWKFGNVYTSINAEDIDTKLLLTDDTYVIVHKDTNEVYSIKIGKPTNCNSLFEKKHLDGVKTNIEKISSIKGFNSIYIAEKEPNLDYIP